MKTLLTTGAFILALAGTAQAQDMFAHMAADQDENSSVIVIDPLTATADGFIAIYDHHRGEVGALLGVAAIREGSNRETRVTLGHPVTQDVIAYLFTGEDFTDPSKAVDSVEIDIEG
jgi:hypothetical protein